MKKKKNGWYKNQEWIFVSLVALLCGTISFLVTVKLYNPRMDSEELALHSKEKQEETILKAEKKTEIVPPREIYEERITSEAMYTSEVAEEILPVIEIAEAKYQDFISLFSKNEEEDMVVETISQNTSEDKKIQSNMKFLLPASGEIGMPFSLKELIYSQTLEEWIVHKGIDILGEELSPVKAVWEGVVESTKLDPRYGNTIIISHPNGYVSVYSNLSTLDLVYVGQKVEKGQIISGIGKGFGFESKEAPHVHFELLHEGENIDPTNDM